MGDTPKNQNKNELRQKLESMKKAYARTLRKVQKSEKANRMRCYVQQKLAEQWQHDGSDASPSCTHRLKNKAAGGGICPMYENVSLSAGDLPKVDIDRHPMADIKEDDHGSKPTMTTRRMQRKRSVSFSIPKENTPEKHSPAETVTADTDYLGPSELDEKQAKTSSGRSLGCEEASKTTEVSLDVSHKSTGLRASSRPSDLVRNGISENDDCSILEVADQRRLIVSESQFADTTDLRSKKQIHEHLNATTGNAVPDCNYDTKCQVLCADSNKNLASCSFIQDNTEDFSERLGDLLRTSCHIQTEDNSSTSSGQQHATKMKTKRVGRKSGRRSRNTRELTVSDISMKEIVESQSTEDGSHTWIEGLVFPAEYYVRRTRSMTSSEEQNQNSGRTEDVGAKPVMKACLTENVKGSPHEKLDLLGSDKTPTDSCESVQFDSDTSKSQLSESVLKMVPAPPTVQEYTSKDLAEISPGKSRKSVKSKRQKQGLGNKSSLENTETSSSSGSTNSVLKTWNRNSPSHTLSLQLNKSAANSKTTVLTESPSECAVQQFHLAVGKVKLVEAEFVLPEDDFGLLKLAKSQSTMNVSTPTSNCQTAAIGCLDNNTEHLVQKLNNLQYLDMNQHGTANSVKKSSPVEISSKSEDELVDKSHLEVSQTKHILHSQLSPTQCPTVSNLALPVPRCTPGWSPTCTPHVTSRRKTRASQRMSEETCSSRYKDENKESLDNKDHPSSNKCITCSVTHMSQTNLDSRFPNNISEDPHSLSAVQQSAPSEHNSKLPNSVPTPERTCDINANRNTFPETCKDVLTEGNTTPPNVPFQVGPVSTKSNIKQVSPFAGVATASPHGRAEEPIAMSQCEVKDPNNDGRSDQLMLMGCLQHDVPWEAGSTILDVTGGTMNIGDDCVSLLAVTYQRTLVIWQNSLDTMEWHIIQSWALPQKEEFVCVRFLPCNADGIASLVVAGRFASCSVKLLRYDTVTKETRQLNVNLGHSNAVPAPQLLCPTSKLSFAVAVRVQDDTSDLYLVRVRADHSDTETQKLLKGTRTTLTSLLLVDGVEGLLIATTSHNRTLLWNHESGELLKAVSIEPLDTCRHASCLKATAESGLLFLVMIFQDDRPSLNMKLRGCVGAAVVLNPQTDKTMTLVEYRTSDEHTESNLIEGVLHGNSLIVQLSDRSLHQWDIFTGHLMNYSSGQPSSCTLRSASICKTEVAILGMDQCQQVYGNVQETS